MKILLLFLILFASCTYVPDKKNKEEKVDSYNDYRYKMMEETVKGNVVCNFIGSDGLKQGYWVELDTALDFRSKEMYYRNDLLDSIYIEYNKARKPIVKGNYKLGKKNGIWNTYSDTLISSELFENDKMIQKIK